MARVRSTVQAQRRVVSQCVQVDEREPHERRKDGRRWYGHRNPVGCGRDHGETLLSKPTVRGTAELTLRLARTDRPDCLEPLQLLRPRHGRHPMPRELRENVERGDAQPMAVETARLQHGDERRDEQGIDAGMRQLDASEVPGAVLRAGRRPVTGKEWRRGVWVGGEEGWVRGASRHRE